MMRARTGISRVAVLPLLLVIACCAGCAPLSAVTPPKTSGTSQASISANAPTLGGTEAAFTNKFGQPDPQYIYTFRTQTAERAILFIGLLQLTTGQTRVRTIVVQRFNHDAWDSTTARAIYQPFLPPDAQLIGDIASSAGTHHRYKSVLLANTFPPGAFMGPDGKRLAPGTFDVVCNTTLITNQDGSYGCGLTIGQWA